MEAQVVVKYANVHYFTDARDEFAATEIIHLSDWGDLDVLERITFDAALQNNGRTRIDISVYFESYFAGERIWEDVFPRFSARPRNFLSVECRSDVGQQKSLTVYAGQARCFGRGSWI